VSVSAGAKRERKTKENDVSRKIARQASTRQKVARVGRTETVSGTVLTNDGNTAQVRFPNGDERFFYRGTESPEAFVKQFAVGGSTDFQAFSTPLKDREGLFKLLEKMFGKPTGLAFAAVSLLSDVGVALVGVSRRLGNVNVFCSSECFHPDGGRGFALLIPKRPITWFHFDQVEVEHALGVIAAQHEEAA
jgi:hypothetical protein